MGRRYSAICEYLGYPYDGVDKDDTYDVNMYSHFIVANPTSEHLPTLKHIVNNVSKCRLRILCEKPVAIVKNVKAGLSIIEDITFSGHEFFMVNQYAFYPKLSYKKDLTYYNFYNTGKDGLIWDCIQLIHLAKGEIVLDNKSPTWECQINGMWLDRETLDECYVSMIEDFFTKCHRNLWSYDDIFRAHLKVVEYEKNINRYPSKV